MGVALRALGGLLLGAAFGLAVAWIGVMLMDRLGWIDHGADGLSGAVLLFGLAALLATLCGIGGAIWAIVAARPRDSDRL